MQSVKHSPVDSLVGKCYYCLGDIMEKLWKELPLPEGLDADYAVRVEGDELEPFVERGAAAYVKRSEVIRDGDVGLFFVRGSMVFRQYCEDWAGNVHLLAVNRKRKDLDICLPRSEDMPVCCFGRLLLEDEPPLP